MPKTGTARRINKQEAILGDFDGPEAAADFYVATALRVKRVHRAKRLGHDRGGIDGVRRVAAGPQNTTRCRLPNGSGSSDSRQSSGRDDEK